MKHTHASGRYSNPSLIGAQTATQGVRCLLVRFNVQHAANIVIVGVSDFRLACCGANCHRASFRAAFVSFWRGLPAGTRDDLLQLHVQDLHAAVVGGIDQSTPARIESGQANGTERSDVDTPDERPGNSTNKKGLEKDEETKTDNGRLDVVRFDHAYQLLLTTCTQRKRGENASES